MTLKSIAGNKTDDEIQRLTELINERDGPGNLRIPKLLTVPEVAEALGLSKARVFYLVRRKLLPAVRIGRNVKVAEDALIAWIQSGGSQLS